MNQPPKTAGTGREKLTCPVCSRPVTGYVPKGGDGSTMRPRWHMDTNGRPCDGRFHTIDMINP